MPWPIKIAHGGRGGNRMVPADIQATRNKDYARENKRRFLQDATLVLLQRSEVTLSKCVDDANTLFELIQRKL